MNLKRRKKEHTLTTGIVKVCGNEMCYKDNICNIIIAHFLSSRILKSQTICKYDSWHIEKVSTERDAHVLQ